MKQNDNKAAIALICVDSVENGEALGRFCYGDLDHEYAFRGVHSLLLEMDRMMNGCEGTSAPMEHTGCVWHMGKLATFKVRVLFRQNDSWQGSVMWLDTRHEERFRSALELISIFRQALVPSQERRMRPSSLRIAATK